MTPEAVLLALRIAMILGLYAFLGFLLFYLQRDVRGAKNQLLPAPQAHLEMLDGENAGLLVALDRVNLLGRAESNTIQINETTVSAQHARLSYQGTQWWLEDLGSRNGTRLNEIEVTQPLVVTYGDIFELGRCSMRLQAGGFKPRYRSKPATIPIGQSTGQDDPLEAASETKDNLDPSGQGRAQDHP